ncbi:hypothetical protein Pcinc_017589 [Petrolisthes cinctipes]|uniref:Transmembrane protein 53 n=1 Tax=Petrolisthes cinctipes TaxID=88211 RepID=A0AAE1FNZ1_PETCI|nr:hypothetical protein Pcinc_017589 [Petrolisthes cinctipes]
MDDDLEYYITFPTPTPRQTHRRPSAGNEEEDEDFVFVNGSGGEKEPVVFLLGWLGAQDRHLAKYCDIYKQRGCITIRYTSPSSFVFVRPSVRLLPIARKLVSLLRDMSLHHHPVFFHVFSNNGSILYYYLVQAMSEPGTPPISVKGCIFDSTPAPRRIYTGMQAAYQATPGSAWKKMFVSVSVMLYLLSWKVISVLWTIISGRLPSHPPWALVEESARCPQLFLYSKADKLIHSDDVEFFISERQKLGVMVVAKCWADSPHVQHYRMHPEEYRESVYSFLGLCLNQEGSASTHRQEDTPDTDTSAEPQDICKASTDTKTKAE